LAIIEVEEGYKTTAIKVAEIQSIPKALAKKSGGKKLITKSIIPAFHERRVIALSLSILNSKPIKKKRRIKPNSTKKCKCSP
jgi:hypothetical protein